MMARRSRISETDPLGNTWTRAYDAMSRVTRITNHALQLAATDLEYEVTRVKSPVLGRDLNPMGRGDGTYYCNGGNIMGGSVAIRAAKPRSIGEIVSGYGNNVNNRELHPIDLVERIIRARLLCPLEIVTCPVYETGREDPCEGMDTADVKVFCCDCMPVLCPECGDCSPTIGCRHVKLPGFEQYCGDRQRDFCKDEPTSPCPSYGSLGLGRSAFCWSYYRKHGGNPYRQVTPKELCNTCGAMQGSGENPCPGSKLRECQNECDRRHNKWFQASLWAACWECCRHEHNLCTQDYAVNCACGGYSY